MNDTRSTIVIQTPRVDLRELELGDDEYILELLNEPGFIRFIGDKGVRTLADSRDYLKQGPLDSYARNGFGLYAARRAAKKDQRVLDAQPEQIPEHEQKQERESTRGV